VILSKKEKEEVVIKLLNEGKTTKEIAQLAYVSYRFLLKFRALIEM